MKKILSIVLIILVGCNKADNSKKMIDNTTLPEAPSALTAKLSSTSKVDLQWSDNSSNETGFNIERKRGNNNYEIISSVASNVTSYSDSTVYVNNTYTYRVCSYNNSGNSNSYTNEVVVYDTSITPALTIGTAYGGGKIAYILQPGDLGYIQGEIHGLIAAESDQSSGMQMGCYGISANGTSTNLGTGASNTSLIVAACGANTTAAHLCDVLVLAGYSDWYLPSRDELIKLYNARNNVGGFISASYWSSSESPNGALGDWSVSFNDGKAVASDKRSYG
jgi:hypothetical protein